MEALHTNQSSQPTKIDFERTEGTELSPVRLLCQQLPLHLQMLRDDVFHDARGVWATTESDRLGRS